MGIDDDLDLAEIAHDFVNALRAIGTHLKYLGVGDAGTTMGAIEFLGTKVESAGERIGAGLEEIAAAIREARHA